MLIPVGKWAPSPVTMTAISICLVSNTWSLKQNDCHFADGILKSILISRMKIVLCLIHILLKYPINSPICKMPVLILIMVLAPQSRTFWDGFAYMYDVHTCMFTN